MRLGSGRVVGRCPANARRQQAGVALLALLTLLTLWGLYLFVGQLNTTHFEMARKQATAAALAEARQALIGRAATDDNRPGSLPCPALDGNGVAPLLAGNHCPAYIGRLPWKTLDVGDLRDDAGEQLWYALAAALRDDDSAQPINFATVPELRLDGTPNIAAIIFSPGVPLANQNGRPGNSVGDYLDGGNNDGNQDFVSGPPSESFNDRVMAITRDDLFRAVNQRVLGEVRAHAEHTVRPPPNSNFGLLGYHAMHNDFPWADGDADGIGDVHTKAGRLPHNDLSLSPTSLAWLKATANDWWPLISYSRDNNCLARISVLGTTTTMDVRGTSPPCP
jgi:hypothetical protein